MKREPASRRRRRGRVWRALARALLLPLLLASSASAQGGLAVSLESVASPVWAGLAVTSAGDGSGRLFIVEQCGLIRIWAGGDILPTPFLDLSLLVACGGELGLLGFAFDPRYAANGYFYVGYTDVGGDTVIARYSVSATDPNVADPASALTLLEVAQPATNHNNGTLAFGPDGYLYVGLGDGGPGANGQDTTTLLGSILRIDPDGDDFPAEPNRNYAIPDDNPFDGNPSARDEIWAYGLRNPWRFSFDRETGDLLIGDVGQSTWEEIDFQPASSAGGENYGWPIMEGPSCVSPPMGCNDGSLTEPVLEYDHDSGCSVTGGYRYRGSREPGLRGVYLYADFCFGTLWGTVPRCDGVWESQVLLESGLAISSFGEDESGEVYLFHREVDGELFRVTRSGAGGPALEVSSATLDFGTVPPGLAASLPLTLTNTNTGPEAVTIAPFGLSDSLRFALDLDAGSQPCGPPPVCLPPGASCTLEVDFLSLGGTFTEWLAPDGNFDPANVALTAVVPCGGPENLIVDAATIDSAAEFVGCQTVEVGPATIFAAGANAAFRAGVSVTLVGDVTIEAGADVRFGVDPSLLD